MRIQIKTQEDRINELYQQIIQLIDEMKRNNSRNKISEVQNLQKEHWKLIMQRDIPEISEEKRNELLRYMAEYVPLGKNKGFFNEENILDVLQQLTKGNTFFKLVDLADRKSKYGAWERKEREEKLISNPIFMRKLDIIMRHNHKTHEYYYHGTALENAESIINNGLYLRDNKSLSVTAVREFDEMGLYAQRDIENEEKLFEWEKECLIEYSRNGGIGEKCVVIIDKPQEEDSIIQKVEEVDAPDIDSEWVSSKPKGVVDSKWIVGYVDKVSGSIVANPLYYDYEKLAKRIAELPEITPDILTSAVRESEEQTKTSEINDSVAAIKSRKLEKEEEKTIEQDDDRWEF